EVLDAAVIEADGVGNELEGHIAEGPVVGGAHHAAAGDAGAAGVGVEAGDIRAAADDGQLAGPAEAVGDHRRAAGALDGEGGPGSDGDRSGAERTVGTAVTELEGAAGDADVADEAGVVRGE